MDTLPIFINIDTSDNLAVHYFSYFFCATFYPQNVDFIKQINNMLQNFADGMLWAFITDI